MGLWDAHTHTVRPARSTGGGVWGARVMTEVFLLLTVLYLFTIAPIVLLRQTEGRGQRSEGYYVLMALLAWADAFGMCGAARRTYVQLLVGLRDTWHFKHWSQLEPLVFTTASRWVGSSWEFQPGALWECCGTPYLSARRRALSLGRKKDSDAFSAVRGLGGLNPWSLDGDMENRRRTATPFRSVVGPSSYSFLADKESCSSSLYLIFWIMMVQGIWNQSVWSFVNFHRIWSILHLDHVVIEEVVWADNHGSASLDIGHSSMVWEHSNRSLCPIFLSLPSLNICFLSVSLSSAPEAYRSRTPQPPLHKRNGTWLVWQGETFYNPSYTVRWPLEISRKSHGVDIKHSTV